ncbi:APC family permease [Microbulbifer agarilyticus]|uniref:amino acid permease n=1 Tax=Microbulbifer agarilyticus TaxID=260552 RepID=UPI001C973DCB|nr:amino acid permease [Microbulbifer agarilyticus]MBY6213090.1 APC family permease [Microbulbifer agarilyticus]
MSSTDKPAKSTTKKTLTATTLGLLTAATVVTSLRGLPMMAQEELTMFIYIGFATLLFLIPAGLVAAELGGAFGDRSGGVYTWIGEAFSPRLGFTAIWLQWIQNVVWYPTGLSFAAAGIAYGIGLPHLAESNIFVGLFCILSYWAATAVALTGTDLLAKVTKLGFLLGTVLPGLILMALAIAWATAGHDIGWETATNPAVTVEENGHHHPRWFPHVAGLGSLAFLGGILLNFAGVEAQATHATEMRNAKRDYPIAIFIAAAVSFAIFTVGALAVAAILPYDNISLQTGVFTTFEQAFDKLLGIKWPVQILALLVCYGALGGALAWLAGPSRGLLATARDGTLPPWLQKTNKQGMQKSILLVQGIIATLISCIYFLFKDVATAFFLISAMTITLYIIMYMMMYAAAIRLRHTRPDLPRSFEIPGGMTGMLLVAGIGFLAVAFAFVVSFFPPDQLPVGSPSTYVILVAAGAVVFTAIPLLIYQFRKPSWKQQQPTAEQQ